MKTITVISDTHGNRQCQDALAGVFEECDIIIHLGDTSSDGGSIRGKFPDKTYVINGNCDIPKLGEDEIVIGVEDIKIFACHGHLYSVKTQLSRLARRATELGCKIALYGHTHCAREDVIDGVTLINPGSCSRYGGKSYLYLVINGGKAVSKIVTF